MSVTISSRGAARRVCVLIKRIHLWYRKIDLSDLKREEIFKLTTGAAATVYVPRRLQLPSYWYERECVRSWSLYCTGFFRVYVCNSSSLEKQPTAGKKFQKQTVCRIQIDRRICKKRSLTLLCTNMREMKLNPCFSPPMRSNHNFTTQGAPRSKKRNYQRRTPLLQDAKG